MRFEPILKSIWWAILFLPTSPSLTARQLAGSQADESYLTWPLKHAETIGKSTRKNGRIGGLFDSRGLHTERSYNFKLRATWFTPEVIRASARFAQLRGRLSEEKARSLVRETESAGNAVFLIEIDPREGSGVIPQDWDAYLQVKGQGDKSISDKAVTGVKTLSFRDNVVFSGVVQRDYDYDCFWVVFPLIDGKKQPVFPDPADEIELLVRIYGKMGSMSWPIPESVRKRVKTLLSQ